MRIPIGIPPFMRNFYTGTLAVFFVWMMFFDSNDFITQYKTWKKYKDMENERDYYIEKIQEVRSDREELFGNSRQLEKFARESYLMKKKTEDVYIVKEED